MPARPKNIPAGYFHRPGNYSPPKALPKPAQALWASIMASTPEDQWRPGDLPLLGVFCRVALLADEAVEHLEHDGQVDAAGKVSPWVRVSNDHAKTLAALSSKLRLAPSSRIRAESHSLKQRPAGPPIWARPSMR
ncbi:MAG: hypothetical protein WKH97_02375 [Casimicrobiaceae bacterium]